MRGGLRKRLIADSLRLAVLSGLDALRWFDPTIYDTPPGSRKHRPVRYIPRPASWQDPIEPNAVAISAENESEDEQGLGGDVEDRTLCYIDVFAENNAVGMHLAHDIRDVLAGRFASIGQIDRWVDVYDLTQATPTPFTRVEVGEIWVDAAQSQAREWQRNWFMLRIELFDDYADEFEPDTITDRWSDVADSWARFGSLL